MNCKNQWTQNTKRIRKSSMVRCSKSYSGWHLHICIHLSKSFKLNMYIPCIIDIISNFKCVKWWYCFVVGLSTFCVESSMQAAYCRKVSVESLWTIGKILQRKEELVSACSSSYTASLHQTSLHCKINRWLYACALALSIKVLT